MYVLKSQLNFRAWWYTKMDGGSDYRGGGDLLCVVIPFVGTKRIPVWTLDIRLCTWPSSVYTSLHLLVSVAHYNVSYTLTSITSLPLLYIETLVSHISLPYIMGFGIKTLHQRIQTRHSHASHCHYCNVDLVLFHEVTRYTNSLLSRFQC